MHYNDFKKVLRRNVYHCVKSFYHSHETNGERDRSLEAFILDKDEVVELNNPDNTALISFFESFEKIFYGYAQAISVRNKVIQIMDDSVDRIENLLQDLQELQQKNQELLSDDVRKRFENISYVKTREAIQNMARIGKEIVGLSKICSNALIEYTYYKTLAHSKNNISFCVENTQNEEHRRKALNIRNSIRYIENIKYVNQTRFNRFSAYKFEESRRIQEEVRNIQAESRRLQEQSRDSINKVRQTEKENSVLTKLSLFLASLFGLAQIAASGVSLITKKGENKADYVFLLAGIVLIGVVISLAKKLKKIRSNKEDNN